MNVSSENMQHIEKTSQGVMQAFEDMNHMAHEYMDATLKSTAAMTKGLGEIAQSANDFLQKSMTRAMSAGKTMANSKTSKEAMDTHSEFMKDSFDCWVAGTGKISEISARMAQDVMGPMADHANNAMNKMAQKTKQAA